MNGVSVIVCCYNSSQRIEKTLEHLFLQNVPEYISWEIILVNNNSTDKTVDVAKELFAKAKVPVPFKIVFEGKLGLNFARKKGANEAHFETLIFCDDDNWLNVDYIFTAYVIISSNKNIAIAGGRSVSSFEAQEPFWFDSFQYAYVIGKQMNKTGIANARRYLTGAAMVVRKSFLDILDRFCFFSLLSDRKGNQLSSGGDSELCMLALYLGYDLYYDEKLQFTHFITASRLSWKYCVRLISKGFAAPQIYFYLYDYCFNYIMQNKKISFEYAYRRNIRKPFKELQEEFNSFSKFFQSIKLLFFSRPGSKKEIIIKTKFNKLLYAILHKKKLEKDFLKICELIKKIKTYKESQLLVSRAKTP